MTYQQELNRAFEKIYNKHYDIALLTDDDWNKEKEKFIYNKNNGVFYKYVPIEEQQQEVLSEILVDDSSITSQAIELFGEDMIITN